MTAPTRTQESATAPQAPATDTAAPSADTGTPASSWGKLPDGGFAAKLGVGLRLSADQLAAGDIDLSEGPQPLPGLQLMRATYDSGRQSLQLTAALAVPHVASGDLRIQINQAGTPSVRGTLQRELNIPALGNPNLTATIDEDGALSGTATIRDANLVPRGAGTATASGELSIVAGKMSGNGTIEVSYDELGGATVNFGFSPTGAFSGDGTVRISPPFVDEVTGNLSVDENQNIDASVTLPVSSLTSRVPGLTPSDGTITIGYHNGRPSGGFTGFRAVYPGVGFVQIAEAALDNAHRFSAAGSFGLEVPMLNDATGTLRIRSGALSGTFAVSANNFPRGLPINSGSINVRLSEQGQIGFSGNVGVDLGPAGSGTLQASYDPAGAFAIGGETRLTIPGLNPIQFAFAYREGQVEGQIAVPIDTALIPGLTGDVTVEYRQGRWAGETDLQFSADDGKLSGNIRVTVNQTDEGALQLGGGGSVTAQLMPRLAGTLQAEILPGGGVDISGTIEVTEPLELFPEERFDKELFKYSQNIPLWAILVAIIRVRAGVRAGVGPGVFRNIRVQGSYTIGADEADPSFTVSGELFIPAFVEGYVAFGAGLGLDVVLGSLTGGIEGVATAGIYGAISVVPELSYADGDWGIEGTATMAAGARLKLGLNAWAEVEALWVTVWEQEWKLAEYMMAVGPDLGLQARMSYKFGQPTPPSIEMNSSDIDTTSMIQEAMPKDGPAGSGAREALENKAEWQGALREQRQAAVPPEVAQQANRSEQPPEPAARPPRSGGPGDGTNTAGAGGQSVDTPGQNQDPTAAPTTGNEPARSRAADQAAQTDSSVQGSVPPDQLPNADQVRYPHPITLATLDEPPAPMPRTRDQEGEDSRAARTAVEIAAREATNSDTLDNYFPRIKHRFGLASLGYEGDFQRGFKVVGRINPDFDFTPDETLSGSGLPGDLADGHVTEIAFRTQKLGGDTVGVEMEASPLGPDHPQGSGPTGQGTLMRLLPTNPQIYRATDSRFIRGHLLNDNVGGPGAPINLFPITAQANALHHSSIEAHVKNWVNVSRYWVRYKVSVEGISPLTTDANGKQFVNAQFRAEASVLNTRLRPVSGLTRRVTIGSIYQAGDVDPLDVTQVEDAETLAQHESRDIDRDTNVQLSSRHSGRDQIFPDGIRTTLGSKLTQFGGWTEVIRRLKDFPHFGDRSGVVLRRAYEQAVVAGGSNPELTLEQNEKGTFTRIVNAWNNGLSAKLQP